MAVLAVSPRGSMYDPSAVFYMEKLVTGPEAADVVDIRLPVAENIARVAKAKGQSAEDVTVVLLDGRATRAWPRRSGPRAPGSSSSSTATWRARSPRPGPAAASTCCSAVGGTPEGIIAACAMKCVGGTIQARLWPTDDEERQRALDAGHVLDPDHVLHTDDLVTGDDCFFVATGITDGDLMRGVQYRGGRRATTESLVMRSRSGTTRFIRSEHRLSKLRAYSAIDFD